MPKKSGKTLKLIKKFFFHKVTEDLVRKITSNLDEFKATILGDIPEYMQKYTVDMHLPFINEIINLPFKNIVFHII